MSRPYALPTRPLVVLVAAIAAATAFIAWPAPSHLAAAAPDDTSAVDRAALPDDTAKGDPAAGPNAAPASPCVAIARREPAHTAARVGEPLTVTIRIDTACQGEPFPVNIVLAVDTSLEMAAPAGDAARTAMEAWLGDLGLPDGRGIRIGVVGFGSKVTLTCKLSDTQSVIRACLNRLGTSGAARPAVGLAEATALLRRSRSTAPPSIEPREIILLVSAWRNDPNTRGNAGCSEVVQTAGTAKGRGILLATLAVGASADAPCLRSAATSPRYAFSTAVAGPAAAFAGLTEVVDRTTSDHQTMFVQRIAVTDTLPSSVALVEGSASPPPDVADTAAGKVGWTVPVGPSRSVTLSYQVTPFEARGIGLPRRSTGLFQDGLGRRRSFPLPTMLLEVAGP